MRLMHGLSLRSQIGTKPDIARHDRHLLALRWQGPKGLRLNEWKPSFAGYSPREERHLVSTMTSDMEHARWARRRDLPPDVSAGGAPA